MPIHQYACDSRHGVSQVPSSYTIASDGDAVAGKRHGAPEEACEDEREKRVRGEMGEMVIV